MEGQLWRAEDIRHDSRPHGSSVFGPEAIRFSASRELQDANHCSTVKGCVGSDLYPF